MFTKYKSLALILLSFFTVTFADGRNVEGVSSCGTGCTGRVTESSTGFNARIFDYPRASRAHYNDLNWLVNSYTYSLSLQYTTTGVTAPSFRLPYNSIIPLFGFDDLDGYGFMLEYKGYFVRK